MRVGCGKKFQDFLGRGLKVLTAVKGGALNFLEVSPNILYPSLVDTF